VIITDYFISKTYHGDTRDDFGKPRQKPVIPNGNSFFPTLDTKLDTTTSGEVDFLTFTLEKDIGVVAYPSDTQEEKAVTIPVNQHYRNLNFSEHTNKAYNSLKAHFPGITLVQFHSLYNKLWSETLLEIDSRLE
jgi:hypothetical protein